MKKILALIIVTVLCFSLVACDSSDSTSEENTPKEYSINELFGTDTLECTVDLIRWYTEDDIKYNPNSMGVSSGGYHYHYIKTTDEFPTAKPIRSGTEMRSDRAPIVCFTFTLKNIGKKDLDCYVYSDFETPKILISLIYDDGYVIEDLYVSHEFEVLSDAVKFCGFFGELPEEVVNNTDKPLKLKIKLPTSDESSEEFYVKIR